MCCAGNWRLFGSNTPGRRDPAPVVRPGHRTHHSGPAGSLLLDHPGRTRLAEPPPHDPAHRGLVRQAVAAAEGFSRTNERPAKGLDRKVECVCGVILELRTQGLYCPPCRARSRSERKRSLDAAWRRHDQRQQRHMDPTYADGPGADVGELIEAVGRLVDVLERGRPEYGRSSRPSTSLALPTLRAAEPRRMPGPRREGGIPADRVELQ